MSNNNGNYDPNQPPPPPPPPLPPADFTAGYTQPVPPASSEPSRYDQQMPGQFTQPGQQAPYGLMPPLQQPGPNRQKSMAKIWLMVGGGLIVIGAAVFVVLTYVLPGNSTKADPSPAPTTEATVQPTQSPTIAPTTPATPGSADPTQAPPAPSIDGDPTSANIADKLQAEGDKYREADADGSLWQQIPNNEQNQLALRAYQYVLIDMKAATRFGGVTDDKAREYWARAKEKEALLLAQKPLGVNININGEKFTFVYDGDTGKGSYTKK